MSKKKGWGEAQRISEQQRTAGMPLRDYLAKTAKDRITVEVGGKEIDLGDNFKITFNPSPPSYDPNMFTNSKSYYSNVASPTTGFGSIFIGEGDLEPATDKETLSGLLGLAPGEEVVSYAVRRSDGSIDVRVLDR